MDTHLNTRRILIFLAFAFGIPWTAALVLYLTVGREDVGKAIGLADFFVLSVPALANLATRLITRQGWRHLWLKPNFRRGWRFYLAAWLLPLLVMIPGAVAYYLLFPQSFDPSLPHARNDSIPFSVAGIANPWMVMLIYTLQYMIIQGLVLSVVAIGEEFGWRAYLLQRLMERFSRAGSAHTATSAGKAAVLVGVIWGVWHLPNFLMQWETYSLFPGAFYLYVLLYTLNTCAQGVLLAWVTLRSGSVWPACIGHATIIGVAWVSTAALKGPSPVWLGPHPDALIGNLGFIVLALVLLFSRRAFAGEEEVGSGKEPAVVTA